MRQRRTNNRALEQKQLASPISLRSVVRVHQAQPNEVTMTNNINEIVMNGVIGCSLTGWSMQDDGMHFDLDDGRVIVIAGVFALVVFNPRAEVFH